MGLENYRRVESLVFFLDSRIRERIPGPDGAGTSISPARNDFFRIKLFIDILWNAVHILKTVIGDVRPDAIRFYISNNQSDSSGLPAVWGADESVFASALGLTGWGIPVDFQRSLPLPAKGSDNPAVSGTRGHQQILQRWRIPLKKAGFRIFASTGLLDFILMRKQAGTVAAATTLWRSWGRTETRPVLIYGTGYPGAYNWDDALLSLYRAGIGPVYRISDRNGVSRPPDFQRDVRIVRELCESSEDLRQLNAIMGIDAYRFLADRISRSVADSIAESNDGYTRCRDMIRRYNIRALLFSARMQPSGNAVIRAARDAGIPVIGWQHGAAGYCYHPMMAYIEFFDTDYHLVFGEGVADNYRKALDQLGADHTVGFIPVGSASLDAFSKRIRSCSNRNQCKMVLYVTTKFLNNRYYFSDRIRFSVYDEVLWDIQRNVLGLASRHPDIRFIVKLHPSAEQEPLVRQYAAGQGIQNVTFIENERSVEGLIEDADIIIFDLNSTGLLQALCTGKPVFVFTGLDNHDGDAIRLLMKRAFVFNRQDEFIGAVDVFLSGNLSAGIPDNNNTDFLSAYGTYLNNGMSGERAASFVRDVMERQSR